jgi:hypothetical protein
VVRVVPWLLEREYRQHRLLDSELPATFAAWRAAAGARLEREGCELSTRTVKMVVHPAEVEAWAQRVRCEIDDTARSDLARLLWQAEANSLQAARARAHRQRSISSCRSQPSGHRAPIVEFCRLARLPLEFYSARATHLNLIERPTKTSLSIKAEWA